jgi:hypothetical protein
MTVHVKRDTRHSTVSKWAHKVVKSKVTHALRVTTPYRFRQNRGRCLPSAWPDSPSETSNDA